MEQVRIQDIPVARARWTDVLGFVSASINAKRPVTIGYVNVHVLNLAAKNPRLHKFLQDLDLCYCDGRGVQWAARFLGKDLPQRMTGADWIYPLCAEAQARGWRLGWVGGEYGITAEATRRLERQYPHLEIVVTDHGFRTGDLAQTIARINATKPDILLVGMGSPRQESWVAQHREALDSPVVWCLGATADYVSGQIARGPKWLTEHHEWLARLVVEPRRLFQRYMIGNPTFFLRMLRRRRLDG
jgi:N-acetylglucosaminyldiphosphoundecaprenol N-acetyl-beta-D-mannosaminyltransferase